MSRLKVGARHGAISRVIAAPAPSAAPNGKADPVVAFKSLNPSLDPIPVVVSVAPYAPSTSNALLSLTVIAVPQGSPMPADAAGWMASAFPRATYRPTAAPTVPATSGVPTAPTTQPVAAPVATPAPAQPIVAAPVAQPVATPANPAPAVPIPAPSMLATAPPVPTPVATTAPAPATTAPAPSIPAGDVSLSIAGVPDRQMTEFQLIEEYDQ